MSSPEKRHLVLRGNKVSLVYNRINQLRNFEIVDCSLSSTPQGDFKMSDVPFDVVIQKGQQPRNELYNRLIMEHADEYVSPHNEPCPLRARAQLILKIPIEKSRKFTCLTRVSMVIFENQLCPRFQGTWFMLLSDVQLILKSSSSHR